MIAAVGIDKEAENLDLYGGVGLFAGAMAAKFGADLHITTVEAYKQATEDAALNLNDLKHAKAVCQATERFMNERAAEAKAAIKKAKADGVAAPKSTATIVLDLQGPRLRTGRLRSGQPVEPAPQQVFEQLPAQHLERLADALGHDRILNVGNWAQLDGGYARFVRRAR